MLLLKVTEWFEYQGSLANLGLAKYSPDKIAPPKKTLQICVKSSCAHNFWQLPQTQIKFYATEKQNMTYWLCQYTKMRAFWVTSALRLLFLTRGWRKSLLFAYIPSTDCTRHLNFVTLELQSPSRAVKSEESHPQQWLRHWTKTRPAKI